MKIMSIRRILEDAGCEIAALVSDRRVLVADFWSKTPYTIRESLFAVESDRFFLQDFQVDGTFVTATFKYGKQSIYS